MNGRAFAKEKYFGAKAYYVRANPDAIKAEMFKNGPVGVAFDVYGDFMHYKSGVYAHTSGDYLGKYSYAFQIPNYNLIFLGGHAVKMIGWGVENNVPYWLCVNR